MDADTDDIGSEITNSVPRDGQAAPTANLPMGGFKHTGVANGSAATDYAALGQVQSAASQWGGTSAGTNTVTLSLTPTPAYAAGLTIRFKAGGTNTGAATLNVSALGAKSIKRSATAALSAGDITIGGTYEVVYDGTNFVLQTAPQIPTALSVTSLATSAGATIGTTLGVTGASTLAAVSATTLSTSGAATLASASVTGNASVGGTLAVTGASTLHATSASTLSTSGLATLNSASVTNDLAVAGTTTLDVTNTAALTSSGVITGAQVGGGLIANQAAMETDTDNTRVPTVAKLRFSPHAVQSWANINSGGTIANSIGVSSSAKIATGSYTVTLDPNFAAIVNTKLCVATLHSAVGFITCRDISSGTSLIEVKTYNSSGVATDAQFHLMVASSP